jgi:hypothetical protein
MTTSSQIPRPASVGAAAAAEDVVADLFVDDEELGRCKREFKLKEALNPSDKEGIARTLQRCKSNDQNVPFVKGYRISGIIHRLADTGSTGSVKGPPRVLLAQERHGQKQYVAVKLIEQEDAFERERKTYDHISELAITVRKLHDYPPHALVFEYAMPLRHHLEIMDADKPLPFLRMFQRVAHMLHTMHSVKLFCHNDLNVDQVLVQPSPRGEAAFWLTDMDSVTRKNQPLPVIRARNHKYLAPEVRLCVCLIVDLRSFCCMLLCVFHARGTVASRLYSLLTVI